VGTVRHVHLQTLFSLRFPQLALFARNLGLFAQNVEMVDDGIVQPLAMRLGLFGRNAVRSGSFGRSAVHLGPFRQIEVLAAQWDDAARANWAGEFMICSYRSRRKRASKFPKHG
jgi:hypothetical protein